MCPCAQTAPHRLVNMRVMTDFLVLHTSKKEQRMALLDHSGRYHVARVADSLPAIGEELIGAYPTAGPLVLVAGSNGNVFRVTFDAIDCGRPMTFDSPLE